MAWSATEPRRAAIAVGWLRPLDRRRLASDPDAIAALIAARGAAASAAGLRVSRHFEPWLERLRRQRSRDEARSAFLAEIEAGLRASIVASSAAALSARRHAAPRLRRARAAGRRDGSRQDHPSHRRLRALARRKGIERVLVVCPASLKAEWEEQIARFTERSARLCSAPRAGAPCRLPRAGILHHRQLRTGARRRRRHQRDSPARRRRAGRGAAHQELANQNSAPGEVAALALCVRADRHAGRKSHRRALFDRPVPRSRSFGPLFRFNRDFYELDERGRPVDYQNSPSCASGWHR